MSSILRPYIISALVALTAAPPLTQAAIIMVGPTSSTAGSFQITDDITFTITKAGKVGLFILDDWVTSDGSQTFAPFSSIVDPESPPLMFSINNGAPIANTYSHFIDNHYSWADVTHNDGYFYLDPKISLSIGDTLTLKAGTHSLLPISGFNPQATQVFAGNMFITDSNGYRLSDVVAVPVPEPAAITLLMGGVVAAFAVLRRRKR